MTRFAIIEAPSPLGLWPSGVERTPEVLLQIGLARALEARRDQRVEPPEYDPVRESTTAMLNPQGLAEYSPRLADAVGRVVDGGEFPVVVGGDCSILLGCTLALRRRGRYGLLFLDGHADFYAPQQSLTGEAADMDLALVSGRGPDQVVNLEGRKPYVRDDDIVVFAQRDAALAHKYGSQDVRATGMTVMDLSEVRKAGAKAAAATAVQRLGTAEFKGLLDSSRCRRARRCGHARRGLSHDRRPRFRRTGGGPACGRRQRPRHRHQHHDLQPQPRPQPIGGPQSRRLPPARTGRQPGLS